LECICPGPWGWWPHSIPCCHGGRSAVLEGPTGISLRPAYMIGSSSPYVAPAIPSHPLSLQHQMAMAEMSFAWENAEREGCVSERVLRGLVCVAWGSVLPGGCSAHLFGCLPGELRGAVGSGAPSVHRHTAGGVALMGCARHIRTGHFFTFMGTRIIPGERIASCRTCGISRHFSGEFAAHQLDHRKKSSHLVWHLSDPFGGGVCD
jgi:hypothetical protein